eukprot:2812549-Prymnesium_polylepis.1
MFYVSGYLESTLSLTIARSRDIRVGRKSRVSGELRSDVSQRTFSKMADRARASRHPWRDVGRSRCVSRLSRKKHTDYCAADTATRFPGTHTCPPTAKSFEI